MSTNVNVLSDSATIEKNTKLVLLNAFYNNTENKMYLKFYNVDTNEIELLDTHDGFLPYTYFKTTDPKFSYDKIDKLVNQDKKTQFEVQVKQMYDSLIDQDIDVIKLSSSNVYNVYQNYSSQLDGINQYEYLIKYYESYLLENHLITGSNYTVENRTLYSEVTELNPTQQEALIKTKSKVRSSKDISGLFKHDTEEESKERVDNYKHNLEFYTNLLSQPVPYFRRMALDIEILNSQNKVPDVRNPVDPIIAVSLVDNGKGSKKYKKVISTKEFVGKMLSTDNKQLIDEVCTKIQKTDNCYPYLEFVETEVDLINAIFEVLESVPIILTYNGDDFDLAYIKQRIRKLEELEPNDKIKQVISKDPIVFKLENLQKTSSILKNPALLKTNIHLDLYRLFSNISLQNYGFGAKYKDYKLDTVAKGLLGKGKEDFDIMKEMDKLREYGNNQTIPYDKVIDKNIEVLSLMYKYALVDSEITLELTTFSNDLTMKLIILLSRLTKTSIEDISRYGISNWCRTMLYWDHRKNNMIIPSGRDLELAKGKDTNVKSVIAGKGFKGAFVMQPKPGIYFDVVTMDFGSLYPSIIKTKNISYETINCLHEECKNFEKYNNLDNETGHYFCIKRHGLLSLLIGIIRDLRIGYFKKLSKDKNLDKPQQEFFKSAEQAQKVLLNGTYGVIGSQAFQMFCLPVAESVTSSARYMIQTLKSYAESLKIDVLYGDTDSIFCTDISKEQIDNLIKYSETEFNVDLEVDKEFKFLILSERKKNYFGVLKDGKVLASGLTGKKNNIPDLIRNCFKDITNELAKANNQNDLTEFHIPKAKQIIKEYINNLENGNVKLEDLEFRLMINRDIDSYGKVKSVKQDIEGNEVITKVGIPQQIKVAIELKNKNPDLDIGQNTLIKFIKTKSGYKLATDMNIQNLKNELDTEKYIDTFKTALDPILDVLNIKFEDMVTKVKQQNATLFDFIGLGKK